MTSRLPIVVALVLSAACASSRAVPVRGSPPARRAAVVQPTPAPTPASPLSVQLSELEGFAIARVRRSELSNLHAGAPAAPDAGEVTVDPGMHRETYRSRYGPEPMALRIAGQGIGRVRLPGGADWVVCGVAGEPPSPIRWETLAPGHAGGWSLSVSEGWIDRSSCRVGATARTALAARAVAWGAAYALLSPDAATGLETLVLMVPRAELLEVRGDAAVDAGSVTYVTLPLARREPAWVELRVSVLDLDRWRVGLGALPATARARSPAEMDSAPTVRLRVAGAPPSSDEDQIAHVHVERSWLERCECDARP